jgi:hypothetical protein
MFGNPSHECNWISTHLQWHMDSPTQNVHYYYNHKTRK